MQFKKVLFYTLLATIAGFVGAFCFSKINQPHASNSVSKDESLKGILANYNGKIAEGNLSFILASKVSTPCVVFIKTTAMVQQRNPFGSFFEDWDPFGSIGQVSSTGSGVIVRKDGYIITNLHVVKDASTIEVVLNNKKKNYKAKLIGSDPSTDLALLKIEADELPTIVIVNSDELQVGEWVVAVGNPFNLTSTVTAGIVSAKGRNINIVNNQFPIESFIQTDAAINPGNSGGALVNLNGELVGINTAIFSKTGSYAGYGFAIPANIVSKAIKDLIDFGQIQRGYTGITATEIDEASEKINKINEGALVEEILKDGPADKAGLEKGDVIVKIQDRSINSKSTFDEHISYYRPADKIKITFVRNGQEKETSLILTNKDGELALNKNNSISSEKLGADFAPVSKIEMQKYKITNGVKVSNIHNGLIANMGIEDGFIFTKFNGIASADAEKLIKQLENASGKMQIEGIGEDGGTRYYNFYY
ncbi:MAG: trypsin-like peptidase domain-containing protein [Bacteroidetes bacterium]|nr:trypsin-like peptidase domain-containing protein [Bacteroidota bacterium]